LTNGPTGALVPDARHIAVGPQGLATFVGTRKSKVWVVTDRAVANVVVAEGELIPKAEESYNHTARVCRVGPDNKLHVHLGQPYNVPPKEKFDLYPLPSRQLCPK